MELDHSMEQVNRKYNRLLFINSCKELPFNWGLSEVIIKGRKKLVINCSY